MGSGIGDIGVRVSADITEFTSAMDRTAQVAATSMARVEQANRIAQAASDKFVKSLQYQIETFGKTEAEILKYKAAQMGVTQTTAPLIAQLEAMSVAAGGHAGSVRGATTATHEFSLASAGAKRELLVLAHELSQGNYSRFGGSLMVLANQTGLATAMFNPLVLAAIAAGGALAFVAKEAYDQHQAWTAFGDAIRTTGAYVGKTQGDLDAMAKHLATTGTGITEAQQAITSLVASGRVSGEMLNQFGQAALNMSKDTGRSIEDVAKELAGVSEGALKWAEEYQKAHHTFTAENMAMIAELDKQGRQADATRVILDGLTAAHKRLNDELGKKPDTSSWTDRVFGGIKTWLGDLVDQKGQFDPLNHALARQAQLQKTLADARQIYKESGNKNKSEKQFIDLLEDEVAVNQEVIDSIRKQAAAKSNLASINAALANSGDVQSAADQYLAGGAKSDRQKYLDQVAAENKSYEEYVARLQKNKADLEKARNDYQGDISAKQYQDVIANLRTNTATYEQVVRHHKENLAEIEKQYQKKTAPRDTTETVLTGALEELQAHIADEKQLYEARKKNLDLVYKNNMMSSADYYAATAAAQAEYVNSVAAIYDQEIVTVKSSFAKDEEARRQHNNKVGQIEAAKRALLTGAQQTQAEASFGEAVLAPQKAYNQLLDQSNIIRKTASEYEKQIGIDERTNLISNLQGMIKIGAARRQELVDLQAVADRLDAIALANPLDRRMAAEALAMHAAIKNLQADADVLATHFDQLGVQGLSNFFENTLAGTKTVGQAFGDMTKMILNDILRMEAQAAASSIIGKSGIGGWLSDLVSLGTGGSGSDVSVPIDTSSFTNLNAYLDSLPHKAKGGYVGAGQTYMVGEVGPEVFTPSTSGTIIPNNKLGSGGDAPSINLTTNVSVNGTTSQSSGDAGSAKVMADALNNKVKEVIVREMRQGGVIWNYQNRGVMP